VDLQWPLVKTVTKTRILEKAENSLIMGARCYVRFCSIELVKFYTVINFRDDDDGYMKRNILKIITTGLLSVKKKLLQLKSISPIMLRRGCMKALDFS
jgi:hypothetical protein